MTDIMDMPAGREMNELIATEVMGWRWDDDWGCLVPPEQVARPSEMYKRVSSFCWEPNQENVVPGLTYSNDLSKVVLPDFSGNDGEALKVAQKLREGNWLVVLKLMPADFSHVIWGSVSEYDEPQLSRMIGQGPMSCECEDVAFIQRGSRLRGSSFALAETLALAICRAAYQVMIGRDSCP